MTALVKLIMSAQPTRGARRMTRCDVRLDSKVGGHRCSQKHSHGGQHTAFGKVWWA